MMQTIIYLKETSDFEVYNLSALQFPSSDGFTLGSKHTHEVSKSQPDFNDQI